ncbi:MAG: hypothetical protein ND807_01600 [Vicinamibacterales bacterium]|nr:hypothetical protein [Vicinamibacterales bacterium]
MKTLIKLLIAALVVHACWRGAGVFWRYSKLKDGAQSAALFAGQRSEAEIQTRVIEIARELDVPLDPEKLTVRKVPNHIYIKGVYTEKIEVVPSYFYPWAFTLDLDVLTLQ